MLDRFLTPTVAEVALQHRSPKVQQAASVFLKELAEEGNPFAVDLVKQIVDG